MGSRLPKRYSLIALVVALALCGVAVYLTRGRLASMLVSTPGVRAQSSSAAGDWMMEGANPSRTRARSEALALPMARQRAIRITGDTGSGSPVAISQNIVLVESEDYLRAIDLRSGKQRWQFEQKGSYISPAVAGRTVYLRAEANNEGQLIALDFASGKQRWAFTPRRLSSLDASYWGGHITSPVVVDDTLFVGAGKEVYALDTATGTVRWEYSAQDYVASSPAVADGMLYISDAYHLLAIDQASGTLRWSIPTEFSVYFAPIAANDSVFFTDGVAVRAVRAADGSDVWTSALKAETLLPGGVQGSHLFVKSTNTVHALDIATGKETWRYSDQNFVSFPAIAANSLFMITGATGQTSVVVLDATTGKRVAQYVLPKLTTAAPIIAGQTLYVRTTDGRVLGLYN